MAKKVLQEDEELIQQRQKVIKVTDRSEHGWATVEENIADKLADNSGDKKWQFRADARAAKKLKSTKEKSMRQWASRGRIPFHGPYT